MIEGIKVEEIWSETEQYKNNNWNGNQTDNRIPKLEILKSGWGTRKLVKKISNDTQKNWCANG